MRQALQKVRLQTQRHEVGHHQIGARRLANLIDDWKAFLLDVKACEQCGPGPRAVFRGNPEAQILIVGQAPGRQEAKEGKPFVGPAGKQLDRALASVKLTEADVLITNPVFFWPQGAEGDRKPTTDELAHGMSHLRWIQEHMKLKLIITLGDVACRQFVNSPWPISRLNGQLQEGNVFPIIHPAATLHQPQMLPLWEQAWRSLAPVLRRLFESGETTGLSKDGMDIGAGAGGIALRETDLTTVPWGPEQPFIHLHNHTEYSRLDGHQTVEEMLQECRRKGYHSIAVTEHGTLAGWMAFYREAKRAEVKPILGLEAYIAKTRTAREYEHIVFIARDLEGYQGLIKLQSKASLDQAGHHPIIEWDELVQLKGVYALTACTGGVFGKKFLRGDEDGAIANLKKLIGTFGKDRVFLEVQPHVGWEPQLLLNQGAVQWAGRLGIGLVATNDNHYVEPNGWEVQDIMMCIRDHTYLETPDRMKYDIHDLYIKDADSVKRGLVASGLSEEQAQRAMDNAVRIGDDCNIEVPRGTNVLPDLTWLKGEDMVEFFKARIQEGFAYRLSDKQDDAVYLERIRSETDIIIKKGFVKYMLLVWELVHWAREHGIMVSPGRGSVSGSLAAYCLGITSVDSVAQGTLMERFLSEFRTDEPDIDLDIEDARRHEAIQHLKDIYGDPNVVRLGTEVRAHGRMTLRDVGRVLGIAKPELDPVANAIVQRSGGDARFDYSIEDSFTQFDVCKRFDSKYPKVRKYASQLEGRIRGYSTHACGLLMTPWSVNDWVPLERRNGEIVSAWTLDDAKYLGLLKLDVLGITALNMFSVAKNLIEERRGVIIDPWKITFDDERVLAAFAARDTTGIFQFGSPGLKRLCEQLGRAKGGKLIFSDLAVLNTLHRPAMLNIGLHTEYVYRVAGRRPVTYEHPIMERLLKDTYGVAMYQESIMMICRELAGLSWAHVGDIRKIISKREGYEAFQKARDLFVNGAVKNGCDFAVAERIFNTISHSGSYAFNKSHAVGYATLAYWQMWLKVHYPTEYHAAILMCERDEGYRSEYIRSAWKSGIKFLWPDINKSDVGFTIEGDAIRIGLGAIDGVGPGAAKAALAGRPYKNIIDFVSRVERKIVNTRVTEHLVMGGAFKNLHPNTKGLLSVWKELTEEALKNGSSTHRQMTLFGANAYVLGATERLGMLIFEEEFTPQEEYEMFRAAVSFPAESHPITSYVKELGLVDPTIGLHKLREIDTDQGCDDVVVAGIVTFHNWKIEGLEGGAYREAGGGMEEHKYVHLNIEDETDFIMTHFDRFMYQQFKEQLEAPDGWPIICEGNVRPGMSKLYVQNFTDLDKWVKKLNDGQNMSAFEKRLRHHPMREYAKLEGTRIWQLDSLWPMGVKVKVLALPVWVKASEKIWRICLQDINGSGPVSKQAIAWSSTFTKCGEELKSQLPLWLELAPMAENAEYNERTPWQVINASYATLEE